MIPCDLKPGDVVQVNPITVGNKSFAACMLVVTEPKAWGCQGYVQVLGETRDKGGQLAFMRLRWDEMEFVGRAVWVEGDYFDEVANMMASSRTVGPYMDRAAILSALRAKFPTEQALRAYMAKQWELLRGADQEGPMMQAERRKHQ